MRIKFIPEHLLLVCLPVLALAGSAKNLPEGIYSYQDKAFLSAAPTNETFREMKKLGVKVAIDLREPEELKGFEQKAAKENGIKYYSVPISKTGEIQKEPIAKVEKIVKENSKKKIWVYCQSANRAGAWLAIHLAKSRKIPVEDAIATAKKLGLSKDEMVDKVRAFLQRE